MATKNLGLVQALHSGTSAPANTKMLFFDEGEDKLKYYDQALGEWALLTPERKAKILTADYTAQPDENTLILFATSNDVNLSLPDPALTPYQEVRVSFVATGYDTVNEQYYSAKVTGEIFPGSDNGTGAKEFFFCNDKGSIVFSTVIYKSVPKNDGSGEYLWLGVEAIPFPGYMGSYADEAELNSILPVALPRWYVMVESTGSFWRWDRDSEAWVDTGAASLIFDVHKHGSLTLAAGGTDVFFDSPFAHTPSVVMLNAYDEDGNQMSVKYKNLTVNGFTVYVPKDGTLHYIVEL